MAKSSQLTLYKLLNSLLFLILTAASVYFVIYVKKFLDSIQTLVVINSESFNAVLTKFATMTENISTITDTKQNEELREKLKAALDNIATFKISFW